jgi:hypothetical protein
MTKLLLFIIILFISVYPQMNKSSRQTVPAEILYSDIFYLPENNSTSVYISYRIPYNRLVFETKGNEFIAEYSFSMEVYDSLQFIERQITERRVKTTRFEETTSGKLFEQGYVKFNLKDGDYKLISTFTDLGSDREIRLRNGNIKISSRANFLQPIVVAQFNCNDREVYKLANYEGNYPFDQNNYELFIPLKSSRDINSFEMSLKWKSNCKWKT